MSRPPAQLTLQLLERHEESAHAHVGVDAFLKAAAMGRPALRLDLDPQVPLVRQADVQRRRFGHNRAIRLAFRDHRGRADASIFFVGNRG